MKALIGCLLFVPLVCSAQIYQCKDSAGKVTLQQTPCSVGASGKMVAAPPAQQQTAPQQQNPEARQLTALIAAALAERDFQRAESLAVTAEHRAMISEAKRFNPSTCKFQYHALGDALGKTLAKAAKDECLSTNGQQGPAYVRWRDHFQMTSARRDNAAARSQQQTQQQQAPSYSCRRSLMGGMDCSPR